MAFLDNSGDIILDAVLTDTGRRNLARADGSFKIVKFALGDDEINYQQFKNSNHANGAHASGSAYYDLEILQTPVLEAFTDNGASMKSKLISIASTNHLYLPTIKVQTAQHLVGVQPSGFRVFVDTTTTDAMSNSYLLQTAGVINGTTPINASVRPVELHQGLDTQEITADSPIPTSLKETQYVVEIDSRFGRLYSSSPDGGNQPIEAPISYIDDDFIASYHLSSNQAGGIFVKSIEDLASDSSSAIAGPRGTSLTFSVVASTELRTSTFLFTRLGNIESGNTTFKASAASTDYYYIDTTIRITGATTGYSVDIPVRFYKEKTT